MVRRVSGVRVSAPTGVQVAEVASPAGRRRSVRAGDPVAASSERDAVLAELAGQGLTLQDEFVLVPEPEAVRRRRGVRPLTTPIEVDLAEGEGAVLLTEQDSYWSWVVAEEAPSAAPAAPGRRGGTRRRAVFQVEIASEPDPARSGRRGWLGFGVKKVTTFVLRFAARAVAKRAPGHLERHLRPGPVLVGTGATTTWTRPDGLSTVR